MSFQSKSMSAFKNRLREIIQDALTEEDQENLVKNFISLDSESEKSEAITIIRNLLPKEIYIEALKSYFDYKSIEAMSIYFQHSDLDLIAHLFYDAMIQKGSHWYRTWVITDKFTATSKALVDSRRFWDVIPILNKKLFKAIYRDELIFVAINRGNINEDFVDRFLDSNFFTAGQHALLVQHLVDNKSPLVEKFYFSEHKSVQGILAKNISKKKLPFLVGGESKIAKKILKKRLDA